MGKLKKRICYILTDSFLGGTERFLLKILKKIDLNKYDIMVITLIGNGDLNKKCDELGIKNHNLKFTKLNSLVNFFQLKKIVSAFKPDIIHSFLFHANYFSAHLKKSLKTPFFIVSERCLDLQKSKFKLRLTRFYCRYADAVTAASVPVMEILKTREQISTEKLILFENGIDPRDYNLKLKSTIRTELNIPDSAIVLVNIGRLRIEKGHDILIKAFQKLQKNKEELYLVLVGNGDQENMLKRLVKERTIKNVIFTGERHDIMNILKGSNIAINSSKEEGFSAFNLEAIISETPIIMTNIGGNKELLSQGIGIPVKPCDEKELTNLINNTIENLSTIKLQTPDWKDKVLEQFSFKKLMKELYRLYD